MKIGIITFHRHNNYGAVLQAYALQKKICLLQHRAEIIDYDSKYLYHPFSLICLKQKGIKGYMLGIMGWILRLPRTYKFKRFKKNMNISFKVTRKNVHKIEKRYDLFLTGSDQVWEYEGTNFDKTFFLDFVKEGRKKNSYAASVGRTDLDRKHKEEYKHLLYDFRHISVREQEGVDLLNSFLGGKAYKIGDPTFLLKKGEWESLIKKRKEKEKYILVYQSGISKDLLKFSQIVSSHINCKIRIISLPMGKWIPCQWRLFDGPQEFLEMIYHAEYIISDSFHATALSCILNKDFYVMVSEGKKMTSSRITGLLEDMGLSKRLIMGYSNDFVPEKIDYFPVCEKIDSIRKDSLEKLRGILED